MLTNPIQSLASPRSSSPRISASRRPATRLGVLLSLSLLTLGLSAQSAFAIIFTSDWTATGAGQNWSDPANWTPLLAVPPYNEAIAGVQFNVNIASPACGGTVDFDDNPGVPTPNPTYVLDLDLGAGCELDVEANTSLTVCTDDSLAECDEGISSGSTFTHSGYLAVPGGVFTADHVVRPGTSQRTAAWLGGSITLGSETAPSTFDTSGLGVNVNILYSEGAGSHLLDYSISDIDTSWNDNHSSERYHQVYVANGGVLELPNLTSSLPPARGEDVLWYTSDAGSLLLPSLNSVSGSGGKTRFQVIETTQFLPQLESANDVQFLLGTNGILDWTLDPGFGPASLTTLGSGINVYIIDADNAGSQFVAPDLATIDTSWNDNHSSSRWQAIRAENGGSIVMQGLTSVVPPARGEDWLLFECFDGSIQVDALANITASGGKTRFRLQNCSVSLPSLVESGDLQVLAEAGGLLQVNGSTTHCLDQRGLAINDNVILVDGAGAVFEGYAYDCIDSGWNDNHSSSRYHQMLVNNGGLADLPNVTEIHVPARGEDIYYVSCNSGGEIALDSLDTVVNGGRIFFNPDDCNITVGEVNFTQRTDIQLTTNADFDVLGDLNPRGTATITTDSSTLRVGDDLIIRDYTDVGGAPSFSSVASTLRLDRHATHDRTVVTQFGMGDSTVAFTGAEGYTGLSFHGMEIGGLDVTSICALLADDNFGGGVMTIGDPGLPSYVALYDNADNGHRNGIGGAAEALYLFGGGAGTRCARTSDGLVMETGSTLALNGLNVYVYEASSGNFIDLQQELANAGDPPAGISRFGGTIVNLPEPGFAASLMLGAVALSLRGRRRH